MDRFFRFSDYDIWAYLSTGMLAIAAWDLTNYSSFVLRSEWTIADGVVTIFASYIVGQILSSPASWLLEKVFVHRLLGSPTKNLFMETQSGLRAILKATLLPGFYQPLDPDIRGKIEDRLLKSTSTGESRFWTAYAIARRDPFASARMQSFLNLYGFCRNITFVGLLSTILIAIEIYFGEDTGRSVLVIEEMWVWFYVSLVSSLLMFHRFLKFYRLYAVEIFISLLGSQEDT